MKVKICGITNLEDAKLSYDLGADAIGFIFYGKSKRYVSPEKVKEIIKMLPPFIIKVGVFVNKTAKEINLIAEDTKLNLAQLHGDETPEMVAGIDLPVIKAFRIYDNFDYSILKSFKNCAFLLDTYAANEYGGTGKPFNWEIIPGEIRDKIILAGGVSIDNIENIHNEINPSAIDVSSSLEIEPGKKDPRKMKQFFNKINELRNL